MHLLTTCEALIQPKQRRRTLEHVWRAWMAVHTKKQQARAAIAAFTQRCRVSDVHKQLGLCVRRWRALRASRALVHWRAAAATQRWVRTRTRPTLVTTDAVHDWLQYVTPKAVLETTTTATTTMDAPELNPRRHPLMIVQFDSSSSLNESALSTEEDSRARVSAGIYGV
jgi:hypothetical protein